MGQQTLTGSDVTIINDRIFSDLADGDTVVLNYNNNLVEARTGKNGNTIYAFNATGRTVEATMRVKLGSSDDKFLNSQQASYISDPAAYTLMTGEFIKRVGDGEGGVTNVVYKLNGGIARQLPNASENVEGETEQGVAVWELVFANTDRLLT